MVKHLTPVLFAIAIVVSGCAAPAEKADLFSRGGAVAVWDLEDLSPVPPPVPDLGELLSGAVIEAVRSVETYSVVEREKLLLALEELHLGSSEIAEENTRLRLGRLVGANWMIFGGYQVVGDVMRLDIRRVHVATGRVTGAVKKEIVASDVGMWIEGAREAALELL
jgi:hypothetical protein